MFSRVEQRLDSLEANVGARLLVLESRVQMIDSTQRQPSRSSLGGGIDERNEGGHDTACVQSTVPIGVTNDVPGQVHAHRAILRPTPEREAEREAEREEAAQTQQWDTPQSFPAPVVTARAALSNDVVSSIAAKFKQTQAALDGNRYGIMHVGERL
jgi:hypothetical protein